METLYNGFEKRKPIRSMARARPDRIVDLVFRSCPASNEFLAPSTLKQPQAYQPPDAIQASPCLDIKKWQRVVMASQHFQRGWEPRERLESIVPAIQPPERTRQIGEFRQIQMTKVKKGIKVIIFLPLINAGPRLLHRAGGL